MHYPKHEKTGNRRPNYDDLVGRVRSIPGSSTDRDYAIRRAMDEHGLREAANSKEIEQELRRRLGEAPMTARKA